MKYEVILCLNLALYPLLADFKNSGIRVIDLPIQRKFSLISDLNVFVKLLILFKVERFNSVHTLTPKAGFLGMFASFLALVPIRLHTFTGQIWVNDHGIRRWFYKLIDRAIVFFSTRIFCDSESQKSFLQDQGIVKKKSVSVIGHGSISGVDIKRFIPQSKNASKDFVFLFVGRITRDKGIYDLIAAFDAVRKINTCVKLWVVGPDEDKLVDEIKKHYPSIEGVSWIGASIEPEKFMATADMLILPSYREGFGSVIIEAAACKTATIAYRIYGVVDAVEEGFSGILINKGDCAALELAMKMIVMNPELAIQMGEFAYCRAINLFSAEKVTNDWLDTYESMLPSGVL